MRFIMLRSRKTLIAALLLLIACLVFPQLTSAEEITIPSADRLSQGDWSYDAMAKLAADGLVPGCTARLFEGDRLFNRLEMAQVLAATIRNALEKKPNPSQVMLIDRLVMEFKPELSVESPGVVEKWHDKSDALKKAHAVLMGKVAIVTSVNPDGNEHSSASIEGLANLSDSTFAVADLANSRPKYFLQDTPVSLPDKAFISGYSPIANWSVGREYMNWGPSYLGGLLVSDNSTPFLQLHGTTQIDFGRLLGKFKITQFVTEYTEDGKDIWLLGRRYEKPVFGGRWHAGFGEVMDTNQTPTPLMFVMPFYLYQNNVAPRSFDSECNCIDSADLLYEARNGNEYYGEWAVDDISAPKLLFPNRFRRPRKTGATLGFYTPKFFRSDKLSTFRAEYTYVDPGTYEATRSYVPELDYRQDGELIGSPMGPDSVAIYLRSEQYLSKDFSLITEYLDQHKRNETSSVPAEERRYVSLSVAHDFSPRSSVSLRVAPYHLVPIGGAAVSSVLYELTTRYTF
jgi:hypothetical protein